MYDELVKRLRELQTLVEHCDDKFCMECEDRELCDKYNNKTLSGTYKEAADAIEDLSHDYEKLAEDFNDAVELLHKRSEPRWIPVTERLPEESEGLNWHEDVMIRFTSVWCCNMNAGCITVRNRLQRKLIWNDCLDHYTKGTAWEWSDASLEPTHWMPIVPLPEPPKEET